MPVAAGFGALIALLVAASSPWWASSFLTHGTGISVALLCIGVSLYALHAAMRGATAGSKHWYTFAALGGGEALWRVLAILTIGLLTSSVIGLEAATVSAVLVWILSPY
ncbi:hypothetical protein NBM05_04080 [Rothia sp. AR01]|uniref:Uncharacterized protein n=1 Tax=Rothia santali TaxID=2949643 RepID=A0A9X2HBT6_9MICC|nr:hypothetical protein [Rothia santali]MCP3425225.1 hypothetical protein [Rothia santali]